MVGAGDAVGLAVGVAEPVGVGLGEPVGVGDGVGVGDPVGVGLATVKLKERSVQDSVGKASAPGLLSGAVGATD